MDNLKFNYQGFRLIAQSTQDDLLEYLSPQLTSIFGKDNVDLSKDYLFALGELPIMLVAHLDTVHRTLPTQIYYDESQSIIWSPQGIGGDDRCGVYSIITILNYLRQNGGKKPSVLFTTFEETGCIGAGVASRKISDSMLSHIKYVIELDRHGEDDCVFYQCLNMDFQKMVETYGFKTQHGSASDISKLCPAWDIAGVNLSIGYLSEHTDKETVNVSWMMATIKKTIKMIQDSESAKKYLYYSKKLPLADNFSKKKKHGNKGYNYNLPDDEELAFAMSLRYYFYFSKETGTYTFVDKFTNEEVPIERVEDEYLKMKNRDSVVDDVETRGKGYHGRGW